MFIKLNILIIGVHLCPKKRECQTLPIFWIFLSRHTERIIHTPGRSAPVFLGQQRMSFHARVEAVTAVNVITPKLNVEDVNKIGIGKAPVVYILLQHIPEYGIIGVSNFFMKLFSANAISTITFINIIGIEPGFRTDAVISRIIQEVLTGHKRPCNNTTPKIIPFGIPEPIDGRNT